MEIHKIHEVNIYINDIRADIYSQDELNLRFNNTFADPSKIQTIQTEYSFTFTLPITPTNEKIFDFANIPSKRNKFNKRFVTHVNVDGILIFDGELILQSVNKEGYKCNLYINRLNTVDKIFGETKLNEITDWEIDYDQEISINEYNGIDDIKYDTSDVFFPLVSYGMFQKLPKEDSEFYTSKFDIDNYNRIYNENFYPSLNLLKIVEKCFNLKDYEVDGDIFDDDILKRIYVSTKLGNEQDPIYNYGKPSMGKSKISFNYSNRNSVDVEMGGSRVATDNKATNVSYDLETPKFMVGRNSETDETYYNWTSNNVYDIWSADSSFLTITPDTAFSGGRENKILWRENRFVAPTNGYYKIDLNITLQLEGNAFEVYGYGVTENNNRQVRRVGYTPSLNFNNFFTEVQLVKNSEDGTECKMITPDAIDTLIWGTPVSGQTFTPTVESGDYNKYSAYPHESNGTYTLSSDKDKYTCGYVPRTGSTLAYDPSVNKDFICGFCSSGPYLYNSVIKNGKSWSSTCSDTNKSRYKGDNYYGIKLVSGNTSIQNPDGTYRRGPGRKREAELANPQYGVNTLPNSTTSISKNNNRITSRIQCIVYLNKNDYLQLKLIQRKFENKEETDYDESERSSANRYRNQGKFKDDAQVSITGSCSFECFSPDDIGISDEYFNWNNASRFPLKLNLSNFLTDDEKMSDFINNFIKEFNLSYQQNGKSITLNKQYIDFNTKNAVDLTDRVSANDIEMEMIDFPSQMSVQYTINEDERGFYISAERNAGLELVQGNDWKEYADRGYDIIQIMEDEYADESKVQTKTSYNWYEDFNILMDGQNDTISIPIIAKDEWMIDGLNDAEMMKQDGYGLNRRYWFPSDLTSSYLYLNNDKTRKVFIKKCSSEYDNVDLSYKVLDNKETLLTKYFNIFYDADTNYIKVSVYLTTDEYLAIKNGSNIIIDDDVYIPTEINGYDCSGANMTEITAIKK